MANTSENLQNVLLLVDTMKINLFFQKLFLQKWPSHGNVYICGHFVKAKYIKFSHPEDAGLNTELPVATRRHPDVYGGYTDTP